MLGEGLVSGLYLHWSLRSLLSIHEYIYTHSSLISNHRKWYSRTNPYIGFIPNSPPRVHVWESGFTTLGCRDGNPEDFPWSPWDFGMSWQDSGIVMATLDITRRKCGWSVSLWVERKFEVESEQSKKRLSQELEHSRNWNHECRKVASLTLAIAITDITTGFTCPRPFPSAQNRVWWWETKWVWTWLDVWV